MVCHVALVPCSKHENRGVAEGQRGAGAAVELLKFPLFSVQFAISLLWFWLLLVALPAAQ